LRAATLLRVRSGRQSHFFPGVKTRRISI
jgi:hypothetical protein